MLTCFILIVVVGPGWAYLIATVLLAYRFSRRPRPRPTETAGVSVLKPLYGDEPGLYDNLRSFAEQTYPIVQIVMGVRRETDLALPAARRLVADLSRPHAIPAEGRDAPILVVDPRVAGSNLKVANLENMLPAARHPVLVLADSDMRVGPDYIATVVAPLEKPGIGVVTCLYAGVSTGGLWSDLGAMHINFGFLPSALAGEALGAGNGCFGATIALRRETLDRIGGFAAIRDELADDHRLGAAVRALGLSIALSPYLVENRVAEASFGDLWRHELRWARTIRAMSPGGFAGSALTHPMALAALIAAATGFALTSCLFLGISCVLRGICAWAFARVLGLPTVQFRLLPIRDALSFAVFIAAFFGRSVSWRNHAFSVAPDGRMTANGDIAP